ncbi:hypothetical protein BS17DRAFT_59237 [Gyrodon lividus]|nr:hypothetical protein BS17DRAFT_59237 [Gyrodon lividus]
MSSLGIPSGQRARTKTSDLSEIFRSAHGSRHSSRAGVSIGSSPTSAPVPTEKFAVTKPRRSMLPFLGRKKPAEQPAAHAARKSSNVPSPVNTVRRSFGNGHAVLMITPATSGSSFEPPLPSTLPPLNVSPPSLGSKFAAHFTPLRSPSKNNKTRHSMPQKPVAATPPTPSPTALSPPVPDGRAASIESRRSSMQSRSTTPRPLRGPRPSVTGEGDEEDFSDLFTLPNQLKQPLQSAKSVSAPTVNTNLGYSRKKGGEASPASPTPPASPCLQFPIPPSTIGRPSLVPTERGPIRSSGESFRQDIASLSSQRSRTSSRVASSRAPRSPPVVLENQNRNDRIAFTYFSSEEERRQTRNRTASHSGSDTDASRAYDSSSGPPSFQHTISLPKPSSMKPLASYQPSTKTASSGPPPSVPLPSPPLSPPSSGGLANSSVPNTPQTNSIASRSFTRLPGVSPRPRANTLSVTSNLISPANSLPKPNTSTSPTSGKASATIMPTATADELRDALVLQRKKYSQLQEYVVTVTKRYEDDRTALTKTIEKLERDVRKKMREIEGLRWLVIHNGAVGDIDAAANLARSSLSTQDHLDGTGGQVASPSSLKRSMTLPQAPVAKDRQQDGLSSHHSMPGQQGLGIHFLHTRQSSSTLEVPFEAVTSSATSSQTSLSLPALTPPTSSPLSAIPEQPCNISRAERQRAKEERRATRALRRISASSVSTLSSGANLTTHLSTPDHSFAPKQSMDEVLEKLRPFGNN